MSESVKKDSRFPCHIYDIADAREAYDSFKGELVKGYGDFVLLENGTVLHDNYMWDDGCRSLIRCKECGGLLIKQSSHFVSFSDDHDGYYADWIAVASEEEADLLNILLGAMEMEDVPCRHLRKNNGNIFWAYAKKEPEARGPEELIRAIREKYSGVNPELLDKLIRKVKKGESK